MLKILQVTDLHWRRALPGHNGHLERLSRHMPALLERLGERVRDEAPDLVAVTGDLLDAPHALLDGDRSHDLAGMVRAAIADYRAVRDWLEGLGRPWMALPGNHDYGPAFDVVFGSAPQTLTINGVTIRAFDDWEQAGNQALRIGASRRRFEAAIAEATEATREVHLQHFLVRPTVDYGYPLLYGDADDLAERAANAPGKRLLLSGHWHEGTPMVEIGNARFAGCPAFCEPGHPFRIFTFGADGAVTMRQEELGGSFPAGRALIVIDRAGLLTGPAAGPGRLAVEEHAAGVIRRLAAHGYVAVASAWHEPESDAASWRGVQYLHDVFFGELSRAEAEADVFALYLPAKDSAARKLPAEAIATEETLVGLLARLFGVAEHEITFLSLDAGRRAFARRAGAVAPDIVTPSDLEAFCTALDEGASQRGLAAAGAAG